MKYLIILCDFLLTFKHLYKGTTQSVAKCAVDCNNNDLRPTSMLNLFIL